MSNSYTKAAFALLISRDDAAMLREAEKAVDLLDTNGEDAELAAAYDTLDARFRAVFPPRARAGSTAFSRSSRIAPFPT